MTSIDTNILVRLFTADDRKQAEKAKRLFKKEQIYITKTVILETEWVLRFAYGFPIDAIADAFIKLLGQENVAVEDAHHVAMAIGLLRDGLDFADALHLSCSQNHTFVTFDKKLVTRAAASGVAQVKLLE
jgi:predicted nucleic-acid-binding protein